MAVLELPGTTTVAVLEALRDVRQDRRIIRPPRWLGTEAAQLIDSILKNAGGSWDAEINGYQFADYDPWFKTTRDTSTVRREPRRRRPNAAALPVRKRRTTTKGRVTSAGTSPAGRMRDATPVHVPTHVLWVAIIFTSPFRPLSCGLDDSL